MNGKNTTVVSVFYEDQMLFCTDSFPVIPNVDEVISIREVDEQGEAHSNLYVVTKRDFVYQKSNQENDKDIYVMLRVRKPGFVD